MEFADVLRFGVIALYLFGTAVCLAGFLGRRDVLRKMGVFASALGFALHTVFLGMVLTSGPLSALPRSASLQILSWCVMAVFFVFRWRLKLGFFSVIAPPLALISFLWSFSLATKQQVLPESLVGLFFGLHIGAFFACFGLMAIAFGAGLLFIHLNRKIKSKEKLTGFRKDLPALSTFDRVNHVTVVSGFPLYSLGMISGFVWAKLAWNRIFSGDPKEIVAIIIWMCFAYLFHQRLAMGWKGRKPALLAVWIFVFLVASFVVINMFVPTHHSFNA